MKKKEKLKKVIKLTLNKETVTDFNNGSSEKLPPRHTFFQKLNECDTPTINDRCWTGGVAAPGCGWTTFAQDCGCSHWSFFNCYD